jgi:hypothetical protein
MRVVDKWKPYGGLIYFFICCWTHWSGPGICGRTPQERTLSASESPDRGRRGPP